MSATQFFAVPELLCWTLSNLSPAELAPLLSANHVFFEIASRLVWKELHDPLPLFALLDELSGTPGAEHQALRITIPYKVDDQVWQRFQFYAESVRKVTNYCNSTGAVVEYHGLDYLRGLAPIAPDVRALWFSWSTEETAPQPYWDMIWLLLGPATASLRCYGYRTSGLFAQQMSSVLERARSVGSALADLTVYPSTPINQGELSTLESRMRPFDQVSTLRLSLPMIDGPVMDYTRGLPNLRTFTLSTWGDLVTGPSSWRSLVIKPRWTGESYPCLDSVRLSQITSPIIEGLLFAQPSLLCNITSLALEICSSQYDAHILSIISNIFWVIGGVSCGLQDLAVEWPSSMQVTYLIPARVLASLFPLDLRRLTLHRVRLDDDSLGIPEIHGKWPALTHLIAPYQPAWPTDLVQLAERETLQVLHVDIKPPRDSDLDAMADTPTSRSAAPLRLESQFDLDAVPRPEVVELAR
ncbi:hypothetical protein FRC09_013318 [Ceratobasidium sp. 395]|nr:hypothetical protein FRC09_013318 [Ceratobasidium sp. 395]